MFLAKRTRFYRSFDVCEDPIYLHFTSSASFIDSWEPSPSVTQWWSVDKDRFVSVNYIPTVAVIQWCVIWPCCRAVFLYLHTMAFHPSICTTTICSLHRRHTWASLPYTWAHHTLVGIINLLYIYIYLIYKPYIYIYIFFFCARWHVANMLKN